MEVLLRLPQRSGGDGSRLIASGVSLRDVGGKDNVLCSTSACWSLFYLQSAEEASVFARDTSRGQ